MENVQKMFNYLFYKLTYKQLKADLWNNKKKLSDPKMLRFRQVCETHLNQITDVFIQIISTIHSEAGKEGEQIMTFYLNVWIGFLKVSWNFIDQDKNLTACVMENVNRSMTYLVLQSGICVKDDNIWERSWAAIDPKFPSMKAFFEKQIKE